jgi:hypothetical protein
VTTCPCPCWSAPCNPCCLEALALAPSTRARAPHADFKSNMLTHDSHDTAGRRPAKPRSVYVQHNGVVYKLRRFDRSPLGMWGAHYLVGSALWTVCRLVVPRMDGRPLSARKAARTPVPRGGGRGAPRLGHRRRTTRV